MNSEVNPLLTAKMDYIKGGINKIYYLLILWKVSAFGSNKTSLKYLLSEIRRLLLREIITATEIKLIQFYQILFILSCVKNKRILILDNFLFHKFLCTKFNCTDVYIEKKWESTSITVSSLLLFANVIIFVCFHGNFAQSKLNKSITSNYVSEEKTSYQN